MLFKKKNEGLQRPGLITVNLPLSVISEQFRTIRTNISFSMIDNQLKSIVVTSAGPGSGKSTVSSNLAATFASEDKKVLLVDCDLRKPTVHKTFKVRNNDGLTSLLTDQSKAFEDLIYRTPTDGLYILTSGAIPPNPAELLNTNRMIEVTNQMEEYFDMVIYDTPPVLAVTDAQILSSRADGTIVVIPKGKVKKEEVIKTQELLDKVKANVIGTILNRVEKSEENYYYYYGD